MSKPKTKKTRKTYNSLADMPEGLRQYTEKLMNHSAAINSCIDTFNSCYHGRLIANWTKDEQAISDHIADMSKIITKTVVNNAVASNWCSFFQELADNHKPSELADIRQAVTLSLIASFNWQIAHYMPIDVVGRLETRVLKSSSYKPTHVFSEKDYKTVETTPLDEAKRSARRYMDKQRGVRIDWKDHEGKNHTYIAVPSEIDGMEDWQTDELYFRFTQENRTDENGNMIDYADMSNNEYFMEALHSIYTSGTITKNDYEMAVMVLNGLSYADVGTVKECSKQYVGKRMLMVYVLVKEYILTDFDYELGVMPADVVRTCLDYYERIEKLED